MRTTFFRRVQLSESGKERLKNLPRLPGDARDALVKWFSETKALPRSSIGPDVAKLSADCQASSDILLDAISITSFVIGALGEHGDSVADFLMDLRGLDFLSDDQEYESLEQYFNAIEPHIPRLYIDERRRRTEGAGAPTLDRVSIAVAMKPVFSKPFQYGEEEVLDYHPDIVDCTPVVQVELEPSDTRHTFAFQMCEDTLNHLIADLLATQAKVEAAKALTAKLEFGKGATNG